MASREDNGIVLDKEVLSESYMPETIIAKDSQIKELQGCISPTLQGQKPMNVWLHGSPGTGKTTVSCYVLKEISDQAGVGGVYVNCWKYNSFYSVLDFMLNQMRRGFGDARDTTVKLQQLERVIKNRPFLIVLDEVDFVPSRERNSMIYNLLSIGKVGLICISESRYPLLALEPRVKSRLSPQVLSFDNYTTGELAEILRQRASIALHPEAWDSSVLKLVSRRALGDARVAIHTLRNAAVYAEAEGAIKLNGVHVDKGFSDTGGLRRTYELKRLTEHHRLLYEIIKGSPGITSPELFKTYLDKCRSRNWKAIASRTFSLYMQKMAGLKLIAAERARVRGRVFAFRPVEG